MRQQHIFAMNPAYKAITLAILCSAGSIAMAQQADKKDGDVLKLEEVVVTATATARSKMTQSNSVSTLDLEDIIKAAPTSSSDVLRAIPGVRSESSGGESNANVTVRGVPISAGGARYVQFQEDGLPILQLGDLNFVTPDTFQRLDTTLDRLEVIRGGSASTMATNAPAGIFNFITKTGEQEGGSITLGKGLNFDQNRIDLEYGGRLAEKTRFYVGGFYREGEGVRESNGLKLEDGYQIKGNITQELDKGYFRLNFKFLDDRTPTYLPVPAQREGQFIAAAPGIDPRTSNPYSPFYPVNNAVNRNGSISPTNVASGLSAKSDSIGFDTQLDLGNNWTLSDKFKYAKNTGRFVGVFPDTGLRSATAGTTYLTGPNAGQAYNGNLYTALIFNTGFDSLDLLANDFKLTKRMPIEGAKLDATLGFYHSKQDVATTWFLNAYEVEGKNTSPAVVQEPGKTPGRDIYARALNSTYTTNSPYASLGYETGPWNVDASLRHDRMEVNGEAADPINGTTNSVNANGYARFQTINYELSHNSYSVGANYRFDKNLAVFARASEGVAFNGDRLYLRGASLPLDGTGNVPKNVVKQLEAGVKYKTGGLSTFITVFNARTQDQNYDITRPGDPFSDSRFEANGVEFEAGYRVGNFRVLGGATYTNSEVKSSSVDALVGKKPRRQAPWIYQVSPAYTMDSVTVGAAIQGTGDSFGDAQNTYKQKGFVIVNPFVTYQYDKRTTFSVIANNIFDKLGFTEVDQRGDGTYIGRAVSGRAVRATVNYKF